MAGYVKYYRDPELHPNRQFIGVAFNKEDTLPYPKNEPRRRKLGMVAHVRKTPEGERSLLSASGLPRRVVRKGGLWDIEELQANLWTKDRKRELFEANQAAAKANAERRAEMGAAAAGTSEGTPATSVAPPTGAAAGPETESTITADADLGAAQLTKKPRQTGKRKLVMPHVFHKKRWLERRRTKVLHLNPRSYAYVESNAALGRLVDRTMYIPPWKLGGRKSRFRSRRKRREEKIKEIRANRELVKREKEKERIAEEVARQKKLAKQRAKGAGKAPKAEKAQQEVAKEVEDKVVAAKEGEAKEPEKPVEG